MSVIFPATAITIACERWPIGLDLYRCYPTQWIIQRKAFSTTDSHCAGIPSLLVQAHGGATKPRCSAATASTVWHASHCAV